MRARTRGVCISSRMVRRELTEQRLEAGEGIHHADIRRPDKGNNPAKSLRWELVWMV